MRTPIGKLGAVLVLTLGMHVLPAAAGDQPGNDPERDAWVEKRIQEWQPSKDERRFDEIGWTGDIRAALRLARQHQRPVFLFTYDGANLACYRC